MSHAGEQTLLFRNQLKRRRFDGAALQILQSTLASKDVQSILELRLNLKEFLRSESVIAIREVAEKPLDHKLLILDFLVHAFAIVNDSCLALRYEALVLRESMSSSHQLLRVSHSEWMTFAEHAFDNGFYSIAGKACENALSCLQMVGVSKTHHSREILEVIGNIQRIKDAAVTLSATHSVQVQTAEYLKKNTIRSLKNSSLCKETEYPASSSFRKGIKRRNECNLQRLKALQKVEGN
ncbi:hypothetical protein Nepgr_014624 [Nepenthes gracilis]|uniref:Uncharacterized protein n=1 Tax=Nepenthes gracilis TaxID=150966 RepID=A0AAD3SJV1_NEPGR|nr:hypothetical protein Nepgr_014624 [Nepenthes gracilis]